MHKGLILLLLLISVHSSVTETVKEQSHPLNKVLASHILPKHTAVSVNSAVKVQQDPTTPGATRNDSNIPNWFSF